MLDAHVEEALSTLMEALADQPGLEGALRARWGAGGHHGAVAPSTGELSDEVAAAADALSSAMPALTRADAAGATVGVLFGEPRGAALFAWCAASTWRRDSSLAPLLVVAAAQPSFRDRVVLVARERVVEGPLLDALACAPLLGDGAALALPENAEARARLEIVIWEAGACALEVPELGKWLWGTPGTFAAMIGTPSHGALRGRVLAARCLEISVCGMPPMTDPELVGRTLQVLQPLLLHPEPLVWVHAARALGRLTGPVEQLEGTLLDWAVGESPVLRQRALTALASLPASRLIFLAASQLATILASPDEDAWVLAALAAATPHLFFSRRDYWDRLAKRILAGDGGAISARALARGLATLWRRGMRVADIEKPLRALREMARRAGAGMPRSPASPPAGSLDEARRWIEVIAVTDTLDDAERDPLDLELGLENLMRVAAQYDDEEADARAARFAASVGPTFSEARRIALGTGRVRQRAAAINALEGCARAFALRLWGPLLATRPAGEHVEEPDLEEAWETIARAPAEILDLVKERRQGDGADLALDLPLEVLAIRLGGYALDACGEDSDLGPGRGPTAHDTCLWLRKVEGLADGSRELPASLKGALSTLFWRLVDTTRGTALGEVDDVQWLGPFAAWWALVIDRPAMLLQLATALPMMAESALASCCERAETLRTAVSSGAGDGAWGASAGEALASLNAGDTELAHALAALAQALGGFAAAKGPHAELDAMCVELVLAADRLQAALANPVKGLHAATVESTEDSLSRRSTQNAPRVAGLVARAIRARELAMLDVWFASLGPVTSALLEAAVRAAIRRTPPPPPQTKKKEPKLVEGYELLRPIGEGGIGSVWLVRKPGADRYFVLKIPKAEALANASDTEREGILASFVEEAKALAGLYHPNVANIIDRGISSSVPFLVLEYLIGADLKQYSAARLMSLYELRQVVLESCAGLAALHSAGLVHRDIKPANLWLRLPLAGGERFEPEKHRDPARAQPLATVVIDFGMVRASRVAAESAGRFVAGTAGYIAPEQVLDPVELDPRSDVYALAGTIYNVTTGRAFFDEIENPRDRIIAHMRRDPFEDAERLKNYPLAVAKLLRAATAREPRDRPSPLELGREFANAL
jgi:eukaryotic-like serine/threonine-protein kinase